MTDTYLSLGEGGLADRRAQAQRAQDELLAERQKQLATQASPFNAPEERIRIWERLHALPLPRAAGHKLVQVIAMQTDLTIEQVQEEQARRAASAS